MTLKHSLSFSICLSFYAIHSSAQVIINDDPTLNKGKVEWQWRVSVGDVPFNTPITADFAVTNNSNQPLIIQDVRTGCHCTVAEYPKEPIEAGKTVHIKATFDAKTEGQFYKIITITTNFDPEHLVALAMMGTVKPK